MPRKRPVFVAWSGEAYRTTSYDVPLWSDPNRRDGRFNITGQTSTQYFYLDPDAPFAEQLRYQDLRNEADAATFRTTLWMARVDESAVVDYSAFENAEKAGFPAEALVEDDYERCQAEASRLVGYGATALLTPSAALPGSTNITLFGPRVAVSWKTERRLSSQMPVRRLPTSPPPVGLTSRVRYFGETHIDLIAYVERRRQGG